MESSLHCFKRRGSKLKEVTPAAFPHEERATEAGCYLESRLVTGNSALLISRLPLTLAGTIGQVSIYLEGSQMFPTLCEGSY